MTAGSFTAVLFGAACLASCSTGRANQPPPAVDTAPTDLSVHRGTFAGRFLLTGELEAVRAEKLVVPRIPNWQTTVRFMESEGALVKAGQRVLEFDTSSFASDYGEKLLAVDVVEGALEQAEATRAANLNEKEFLVEQRRVAVEKAKIQAEVPAEFLRGQDWQENQLVLRRAETALEKAHEEMRASMESADEAVRQQEIALARAERDLAASRQAMEGMILEAPRDGIFVVGEHPWEGRKFQVGDSVWVGLSVASLPDLTQMRVVAKLSDVDDGRIAPGLPVVCTLDAFPDKTYTGRIAEVMPVAQEQARRSMRRAHDVRVDIDNADAERMRPGMSVKIEVLPPERAGVLLVPRAGIEWAGGKPKARLASGGTAEVKLGPCNAEVCIVESGLSEGDRLRSGA